MSISTLQEKIFNKGCGTAFLVVATGLMGLSFVTGQCNQANRMDGQREGGADVANIVATVGGLPVSGERIQAVASQKPSNSVLDQAQNLAGTTDEAIRLAALQNLLAKGPAVTPTEIENAVGKAFDEKIDQAKMMLTLQNKLKKDATPADLELALKDQLAGKTIAQTRAAQIANARKAFDSPDEKAGIVLQFAEPILTARYGDKLAGDDAALRESYKTYNVKRIFFGDASGSTESAAARAGKAEAALKSGAAFDKLMDTVSNDPSQGRAAHDVVAPVSGDDFAKEPSYAELRGKDKGATTGVVDVPGGKAIYQLASVADNLPADFERNKTKYRDERASIGGRAELQRQLDALLASDAVKWQSAGFHALEEAFSAGGDAAKRAKAITDAKALASAKEASDKRLGAMALLVATSGGSGPDRIAALESAAAAGLQDGTTNLELAKLYGTAKDGAKATAALLAASKANVRYDATGQGLFGDINAAATDLQKKGALTKDELTTVQTQQAAWSAAREENEKSQADSKKQADAAQKANDAEIARQKAEAAKNAPKPTTPPPGVDVKPTLGSSPLPPTNTGSPIGGAPVGSGPTTGGKGK